MFYNSPKQKHQCCAIYRGAGGAGDAVADAASEASLIKQLAIDVQADADAAEASKNSAASSASAAATSATNSANSASSASSSATSASNSAATATTKASEASTSATNAANSATAAQTAETNAETAETNAAASASAAATSASNVASSASSASTSAANASSSASAAATSATNASNSASAALTSANNAASSATTASSQASAAATSATNAANSASAASTSATNAAASATSASNSASTATTQATNASNSASSAATSASNAATSATNAANSASSAATSATNAANSFDEFDDRYLGAKSSAPTVDNDGNTLLTGALYFDTVANSMRIWSGSAWLDAYANLNNVAITGGSINGTTIGATTPSTGSFTSLTDSGNLTFTGTGNRIRGDFSNATVANRLMFQTSTTNGNTIVGAIPNGTGLNADFRSFNNSDLTNASFFQLGIANSGTEARLNSSITGTGTYLPMTFVTGGSERLRIDTSGNVGVGTSSPAYPLVVSSSVSTQIQIRAGNSNDSVLLFGDTDSAAIGRVTYAHANNSMSFTVNSSESMRIDSSGNVGIGTSSPFTRLEVNSGTGTAPVLSVYATNPAYGAGDVLGTLGFGSNGSGNNIQAAAISGINQTASSSANGILAFSTRTSGSVTEKMRIDSSGNVGIGGAPTGFGKLDVRNGTNFRILVNGLSGYGSNSIAGINDVGTETHFGLAGSPIVFYTNALERMRIDSSGNVGIGTSSLGQKLVVAGATNTRVQVDGSSSGGIYFTQNGSDAGTISGTTSRMAFFAGGYGEAMRIDSSGFLSLACTGMTSDAPNQDGGLTQGGTGNFKIRKGTNGWQWWQFYGTNTSSGIGNISNVNNTGVAYNTSSDVRLKENIVDSPSALDSIGQVKVRSFDWKLNGSHQEYGFVAQEVDEVAPEIVSKGMKDDDFWAVDYSRLVPRLVKAIQEQQAIINDLKARIETLESK